MRESTQVVTRRRAAAEELRELETGEGRVTIADPPEFEPDTPAEEEDPTEFWSGPDRYPDLYGGGAGA